MGRLGLSGIVLAAGYSSRMGACKALLQIDGASLLERTVRLFRETGVERIVVVTGARPEIRPFAETLNVTVVENPHFDSGMFSSVQTGIAEILKHPSATYILPVDIPLLRKKTLLSLQEHPLPAFSARIPTFGGRRGHPPLLGAEMLERVISWNEDGGLRGFLEAHGDSVSFVAVPDQGILIDADTPTHLERCRRLAETREQLPSKFECSALLDLAGTPRNVRRHCRLVARVAHELGRILEKNEPIDLHLLDRAARLHDIKKRSPDHAHSGAVFLRSFGFDGLAAVVAHHQDPSGTSVEEEVLSLADKLVRGDVVVSLDQRAQSLSQRFSDSKAIEAGQRRLSVARNTLDRIRSIAHLHGDTFSFDLS